MQVLDDILASYVAEANQTTIENVLLGVGFTVVNKDGIIYSGSAGRQGFDIGSTLYSTDSVQWIASMTKIITTICLLQLVERGVVTLAEDLRLRIAELAPLQILQGFNDDDEAILINNTQPLTLRHLLTHTSGFAYDIGDPDLARWSESINRKENASTWSLEGFTTPLKFPPGQGWTYGSSLDWAGYVLEVLTDDSLSQYMEANIFAPLDMSSTAFNISSIPQGNSRLVDWATVSTDDEALLIPGKSWLPAEYSLYSGGSGLHSTTADYAKFLSAMLRGDLLKSSTHELVFTAQLTHTERLALTEGLSGDLWNLYVPEIYPMHAPVDHGLSGIINLADSPGRRRKGSLMWSGASNGRWWIDRDTGIAAVMTTQVEPYNHPVAVNLFKELEAAVYDNLV